MRKSWKSPINVFCLLCFRRVTRMVRMSQLHHHIHCLQSFPDTGAPQYWDPPGLVASVVTLSSSALTKFSAYNQEKNGATGHCCWPIPQRRIFKRLPNNRNLDILVRRGEMSVDSVKVIWIFLWLDPVRISTLGVEVEVALLASSVKQRCDSVTYTHCRDLQNTTNGVTENYGNILNGFSLECSL